MIVAKAVLLVLVFFSVDSALTTLVNVALRKPTKQVNQWNENSYLATDGNYDPRYKRGSCTNTNPTDSKTWWIVDLLQTYNIHTLRIQNRIEYRNRLQDFYIYVSVSNPLAALTNGSSFPGELCLYYPVALPAGQIQELNCSSSDQIRGRYVYVWKEKFNVLSLCEFEVLVPVFDEGRFASGFLLYPGNKSSSTPIHRTVEKSMNQVSCLLTCVKASMPWREATHFQVNKHSGVCECIQFSDFSQGNLSLSSDEDFDVYEITDVFRSDQ